MERELKDRAIIIIPTLGHRPIEISKGVERESGLRICSVASAKELIERFPFASIVKPARGQIPSGSHEEKLCTTVSVHSPCLPRINSKATPQVSK